jgi:hypothetical protein
MNAADSFQATIKFGLLYLAAIFIAAIVLKNEAAMILAVATIAASYLTQVLQTTSLISEREAFGPNVQSDDDPNFDMFMARAKTFQAAASFMWLATAAVGAISLFLLARPVVLSWL